MRAPASALAPALAALGLLLPPAAGASAFLGGGGAAPRPAGDLLEALEAELGSGRGAEPARAARLQRELEHTFAALPKNRRGRLQAAGARYALHRLFVQRHGWQLVGLAPDGGAWANGSAAEALGDRVPAAVRSLVHRHLSEEGVGLRELAALAALLEGMVHGEADARLRVALRAHGRGEAEVLDAAEAGAVLRAYMASYVLGVPLAELSPEAVRAHVRSVQKAYPTWPDTQAFLEEVRASVAGSAAAYDFQLLSAVLAEVGDRYGRWQSRECTALKTTMVGLESRPGSGRVRLGDFYGGALSGEHWQFSESLDYLRQLGALDESEAGAPSVIIPNYIGSPSNCVASSGYYAVCCIDECEELMDQLERRLRAPTASAEDVAAAVSDLTPPPSNGTLPAALLRLLGDVAAHHGGAVPLHGRLFAQWMHHAYPRECPFPHVTGTTSPLSAEDFAARTGAPVTASKDEMRQFARAGPSRRRAEEPEEGLCSSMWTMEEELVDAAAHEAHARGPPGVARAPRALVLCLAAASAALALARMAASALAVGGGGPAKPAAAGPAAGATYSV